ncbi:MAG: diacylglycerol kinase (ATP) [Desulforhopalus sp.]|jgi:diacylglycerol kinase (ATP)
MKPASLKTDDKPRVGVLVNPLSGKNCRGLASIFQIIGQHPKVLQRKVQTPQDVYEALMDFARQKVNLLVISGGDGTVQAALTVLFHHHPFADQPQLMVLEGGTTNMIAGDVGVLGNQDKALARLFHWMEAGSGRVIRIERPILRLQVPGYDVKYGMFFGAAIISQGTQYYHRTKHNKGLRGLPGICMTIVRFLWGIIRQQRQFTAATHIKVRLNKQLLQTGDFMLLFVSTLDRLFFGLRPFWGIERGPLRFTAVSSRAGYLLRVLPFLARGRRAGKGTRENGYYSHNVDEVELYIADSVVLDGEMYTPESGQQPTRLQHGGNVTFIQL